MTTLKELADEMNDPDVRYALGDEERAGILAALKDAERFAWLLEQSASVQDAVLRPPIPPELLESPEKWPEMVRATINEAMKRG